MREQTERTKKALTGSGPQTPLVACGFIALVALVVYGNSLFNPLFYDDEESITLNPSIRQLWPIWAPFWPPDGSNLAGRPLLNLTFAVDYAMGGSQVWIYHATNLLIHLLAALTLFGIVRRTLLLVGTGVPLRPIQAADGRGLASRPVPVGGPENLSGFARELPSLPRSNNRFAQDSLWLALAVTLLWLVHPLQTESVSYISQRSESFMGLFYLLTLYCFIRGARGQVSGTIWLSLSVAACLLGMAVKEVMITAPLMVLIYDRTFVAGTWREAWRVRAWFYAALMATWLVLGYLLLDIGRRAVGVGFGASPWNYALTQCQALVHYLVLTVYPHPLVIDYGMTLVQDFWQVWPQALFLLLLLAGTMIGYMRWPVMGFLGIWFFLILAPTSSFIPIMLEPMAEHRMYLPLASLFLLLVLGLYHYLGKNSRWPIIGLLLVWSVVTMVRNEDYGSGLTLWRQSVEQNPENARAHHNEGLLLLRAGNLQQAIEQFQDAVHIFPDYVDAHLNWGFALCREGEYAEAIGHYQAALRINPNYYQAHNNWGVALAQAGHLPEAVTHFQEAVQINPDYAEGHRNLGLAFVYLGHKDEARKEFERALQLDPQSEVARDNLSKLDAGVPLPGGK